MFFYFRTKASNHHLRLITNNVSELYKIALFHQKNREEYLISYSKIPFNKNNIYRLNTK